MYASLPSTFVPQASPETLVADDNIPITSTSKRANTMIDEMQSFDSPKRMIPATEVTLSTSHQAGTPSRTTSSSSGVQRSTSRISLTSPPIAIHGATPTRTRSLNPILNQSVTFLAQEQKSSDEIQGQDDDMSEKITNSGNNTHNDSERMNNIKRTHAEYENKNQQVEENEDSPKRPPRVKRREIL